MYKQKYCVDGNTCRLFAKPLKNTAVDDGQLIRLFEVNKYKIIIIIIINLLKVVYLCNLKCAIL